MIGSHMEGILNWLRSRMERWLYATVVFTQRILYAKEPVGRIAH